MQDLSVRQRLDKIQQSIDRLSMEKMFAGALEARQEENSHPNQAIDGDVDENNHPADVTKSSTTASKDAYSFQLGLELFGQETAQVERTIQSKLADLEKEIQQLAVEELTNDNDEDDEESRYIQVQQLRALIACLDQCSQARALLDESVTLSTPALGDVDLVQAAQLVMQAQAALDAVVMTDQSRATVQGLHNSVRQHRTDLVQRARSVWYATVSLQSSNLTVQDCEGLRVAYEVLRHLGSDLSRTILQKFTTDLYAAVLQPILEDAMSGSYRWVLKESQDRIAATDVKPPNVPVALLRGPVHRLEWTRQPSTNSPWPNAFQSFERILVFVADRALLNEPDLSEWLGKRFFGNPAILPNALNLEALGVESCRFGDDHGMLLEPLLQALTDAFVPVQLAASEVHELAEAQEALVGMTTPFLNRLQGKGLIDARDNRLVRFGTDFDSKYMEGRRVTILSEARDLLLDNDYHNTVQVGEDKPSDAEMEELGLDDGMSDFFLLKASISDTAFEAIRMARMAMDECVDHQHATGSLEALPSTLYRTARECLDLFRAIVPVTYAREIQTVPRTAAVYHNDNVFLAYNCLTIGLEYREKMEGEESLRKFCHFVDMVPVFREQADNCINQMLGLQAEQIKELVAPRTEHLSMSLRSNDIVSEWGDAELALEAAMYHLRHLTQAWKPILSTEVFTRSLSFLADELFTLFLNQVVQASDISVSACSFVNNLFDAASAQVQELLSNDTSHSRVWQRFDAIGRVMTMSLADIHMALADGVFACVIGVEVAHLVEAIFDDSPRRRHLLNILSTSG